MGPLWRAHGYVEARGVYDRQYSIEISRAHDAKVGASEGGGLVVGMSRDDSATADALKHPAVVSPISRFSEHWTVSTKRARMA